MSAMNPDSDLSVYLIYSSSQSAFKIGVSVDPTYRASELRWSANNPWGRIIETQLCEWWTFSRSDAFHVEASALERTQEIAFHHSEWRTDPDSGHETLKEYMAETRHYIDEMSKVLPSYRGHGHFPDEGKSRLKKDRQFSCYIDPDLKSELRRICDQMPPSAIEGGQSGLVERALRAEVARLRSEYNKGEPFLVSDDEDLAATKPKKPKTVRATFHLREALVDEVRDACYWVPGLSMGSFADEALSEALKKIEAEKGPFEMRPDTYKGGRPVGS